MATGDTMSEAAERLIDNYLSETDSPKEYWDTMSPGARKKYLSKHKGRARIEANDLEPSDLVKDYGKLSSAERKVLDALIKVKVPASLDRDLY